MTNLLEGRFCLANEAIRDEGYRNYFRQEAKEGRQVILDNGVFESDLVTDKRLVDLTKVINPPVLIVPDKINAHWEKNYDRAVEFTHVYESELCEQQLMFVVQTKYSDEQGFWTAIDRWLQYDTFKWLGICRDACRNAFSKYTGTSDQELNRFYFLSEFVRRGYLEKLEKQDKKIHLLGLGDNVWMLQYMWFVESIDTASLFWQAATYGNLLHESGKFYQLANGRPYNYMEQNYEDFFEYYGADEKESSDYWRKLVAENCERAQAWANKANQLQKQKTFNARI